MAQSAAIFRDSVSAPDSPPEARLISLDVLRGATMALMILVNTAGGFPAAYPPLLHASWNGWTITDVVFPTFVWIVGLSLALSLSRRLNAGVPRSRLVRHVLRRGLIIYLLGLLVYAFPRFDLSTLRLLGVLQRIAICYTVASLLFLFTGWRAQLTAIVVLLGTYWALMMLIPVPGYGAGRLDVEGNLAHYVDRIVLGSHNYRSTKTWDPEGVISTLPAIASALLGVMASFLVRLRRSLPERTVWLFLTGNVLIALGLICDTWLPINKKLWTTSFALFMAGLDFELFAASMWVVDGLGHRSAARPFVIFGMNAITIYMIAELLETTLVITGARQWLYSHLYAPFLSQANASLLFALSYVGLMFLIAWTMYRRKVFLRV